MITTWMLWRTLFIMVSEPEDALPSQSRQQVDIVLNWFEELRRVGSRD